MKYNQLSSVEQFLTNVDGALLKEDLKTTVQYSPQNIPPWNVVQIDAENQNLLNSMSGTANVYALLTAPKDSDEFSLRYIGKT